MERILTFQTTNHAIKAEQALLAGRLDARVMPLPPSIKAGCGLCLRLPPEQLAAGLAQLSAAGVPVEAVYTRRAENGKSVYEEYCDGET